MSKIKETEKPNFLVSLATFIVDKRNLFFLVYFKSFFRITDFFFAISFCL